MDPDLDKLEQLAKTRRPYRMWVCVCLPRTIEGGAGMMHSRVRAAIRRRFVPGADKRRAIFERVRAQWLELEIPGGVATVLGDTQLRELDPVCPRSFLAGLDLEVDALAARERVEVNA